MIPPPGVPVGYVVRELPVGTVRPDPVRKSAVPDVRHHQFIVVARIDDHVPEGGVKKPLHVIFKNVVFHQVVDIIQRHGELKYRPSAQETSQPLIQKSLDSKVVIQYNMKLTYYLVERVLIHH